MNAVNTTDAAQLAGALMSCDREPIHIPGAIQPHGYLLVLDAGRRIVQASANLEELIGHPIHAVLGQPVQRIIGEVGALALTEAFALTSVEAQPLYIGRIAWSPTMDATLVSDTADAMASDQRRARGERTFDLLLHAHATAVILEMEPTVHVGNVFGPMYGMVRTFASRLQGVRTIEELADAAAVEVRRITGFGRVLVYRFDEDDNGRVLAEDRDPAYSSYLDHRFPASDVPAQARALYLRHRLRAIPSVDYTPAPLVPVLHPDTQRPTDLSYAMLRSVSPVHLEYMRNMGTASSMSISIVVRGKLWGLISCHHETPRYPRFDMRAACEHVGDMLSLQVEAKEENADAAHRLTLRSTLVDLVATMSDRDDFVDSLGAPPYALLRFMSAQGAAIIYEGRTVCIGDTPDKAVIETIVAHVASSASGPIYATDRLSTVLPALAPFTAIASGLLSVQISRLHRHFVMWFRPEVVQTIQWAGPPEKTLLADSKPGTAPGAMLSPRKSFDTWKEIVRHRSLRWQDAELDAADAFRIAVLGIVLRRAEEMASLASELGRANKELESFSYSVSHDLRAPLRHVLGYADLLKQHESERLSERGLRFLKNVGDAARLAGTLVDDLLSFSQMGRAALRPAPVDLNVLFHAVINELRDELVLTAPERVIEWEVKPLPTIRGDAAFLMLAVRNLLANAVKYTRPRTNPHIAIHAEETDAEHVIVISDNGVGFNMRYVGKLFGVFQRLHRAEEFEGTGIGLANVRRIVERHDGRTWAEGVPDQGARFYVALPKKPHQPPQKKEDAGTKEAVGAIAPDGTSAADRADRADLSGRAASPESTESADSVASTGARVRS